MSILIPRETIDALRNNVNVAMDIIGIDCTLYIPATASFYEAQKLDVFSTPQDLDYFAFSSKVFITWTPSTYMLKKLGLFVEGQLPIVARFGTKGTFLGSTKISPHSTLPGFPFPGTVDTELATYTLGEEADVEVSLQSYFRIVPEFVPGNTTGTEDFEVVNVASAGMHDASLVRTYSAVPRRVRKA